MERVSRVLLTLDDPEQRNHVEDVWEEELFQHLRNTRHAPLVLSIPLLLGKEACCRRLANEALNQQNNDSLREYFRDGIQTEFVEPMLKYLAGELGETSDEELLAKADNTNKISMAHWLIALKYLARGDRKRAFAHFDEAASEIAPWVIEAFLAKAFRDRMKHDPNWPNWIELRPD